MKMVLISLLGITFFTCDLFSQAIYYVDASATGANNGSSWTDAYTDLHDGLSAAVAGDQVWVAQGTYTPSKDYLGNASPIARTETFFVPDGVVFYGSFAGTETSIGQRDIPSNPTILSGDIGTTGDNTDNCYHVVVALGPSGSSLGVTIDGFTISGGNADQSLIPNSIPAYEGGGMYIVASGTSAVNDISNNIISDNTADYYGGIYLDGNGAASNTVSHNTITGNSASGGIGYAGGMYLDGADAGSNTLNYNTVSGNSTAGGRGGGLYIDADDAITNTLNYNTITGNSTAGAIGSGGGLYFRSWNSTACTFSYNIVSDNTAASNGGGMYLECINAGNNTVNYNIITDNTSSSGGGGIYLAGSGSQSNIVSYNSIIGNSAVSGGGMTLSGSNAQNNTLINNSFSANFANNYGGFNLFGENASNNLNNNTVYKNGSYSYGGIRLYGGTYIMSNVILWGNTGSGSQFYLDNGATGTVSNSIIEGGWTGCINCPGTTGDGNIDPLIGDESDLDGPDDIYRTADDGLTLRSCSPAIDAGIITGVPTDDITGYTRDSNPDIGAYEFQGNYICSKYYVDAAATTGANNGSSWTDAFIDIQDALSLAQSGDSIWVAQGTYVPSLDPFGSASPPDSRDKTFLIEDGVHLYGGFSGTEASIGARDIPSNPTILSGDLGIVDDISDNTYHVVMALGVSGSSSGVTIDGFTITKGNADGTGTLSASGYSISRNSAGGIFIELTGGSAVNSIINSTVSDNAASLSYGGLYLNGDDAINFITNNYFTGNSSNNYGGMYMLGSNGTNEINNNHLNNNTISGSYAGIRLIASNATNEVSYNIVTNNSAAWYGGIGLSVQSSVNNVHHNTVTGNSTTNGNGGAINMWAINSTSNAINYNIIKDNPVTGSAINLDGESSTNEITHNTITGNSATGINLYGKQAQINLVKNNTISNNSKGMYFYGELSLENTISNNTFSGNSGGVTVNGNNASKNQLINNTFYGNNATSFPGIYLDYGTHTVSNNILWNNTGAGSQIYLTHGASATVSNSIIEGGWAGCINCPGAGDGNIDPRIADGSDIDGPDDIHRTADDGLTLRSCSPAIDAGTATGAPPEDITGYTRSGNPDIGAYEFQGNYYCTRYYVDSTATGANNGSSWVDAFTDLQDALSLAQSGDSIWAAKGTYFPSLDPFGNNSPTDPRDKTFFMRDGVRIVGGFAGTESSPDTRNIKANPTILNGDIGIVGTDTDNCYHVVLASGLSGSGNGVIINGITITGGNADGTNSILVNGNTIPQNSGGGLYLLASGTSARNIISQNTITGNVASNNYGGIYLEGSNALINRFNRNTFNNNSAANDGGGAYLSCDKAQSNVVTNNTIDNNTAGNDYGGMYLNGDEAQSNSLTNNTLTNNSASNNGGGMYVSGDNAANNTLNYNSINSNTANNYGGMYLSGEYATNELTQNTVIGNTASNNGGGMYLHMNLAQSNTVSHNIFNGNTAIRYGGLYIQGRSSVAGNKINNNTISGNAATSGNAGGIQVYADNTTNEFSNNTITNNSADRYGGGLELWPGNYTVTNNLLWGNIAGSGGDQIYLNTIQPVTATVNNSIIEGGWSGCNNCPGFASDGNIDPLIVNDSDIDGPDDIHRTADDGLTIKSCSPAIDAGTASGAPVDDITGFTRDGFPDIGAYEFQNIYRCNKFYVDSIATGANDGSSWVDAFIDLQDALAIAGPGDSVWVAKGTYKPSALPPGCVGCSVLQDFTFFLNDGVRLYGGFAGVESMISQRDIPSNPSILSGDVGVPGNNGDNCFHVVLASAPSGSNSGVTIDGFTVTGGNADASVPVTVNGNSCFRDRAGGIYIVKEESASNIISNNTISGNSSTGFGGAIYLFGYQANNKIFNNSIIDNSGGSGGGIYLKGDYAINEVDYNTISNNSASTSGGIYMWGDYATNKLSHNTITGNSSGHTGGIYLRGRYAIIEVSNNNIANNVSTSWFGGIWLDGANADSTKVIGNIISDNQAVRDYGGLYWDGTSASFNTLSGNTINGNTAGNGYGGLFFEGEHAITNTITGNTISDNEASNGSYGGAHIYCFSGTGSTKNILIQNTISGNSASNDYGGIYLYGGNADNNIIRNTISLNSTVDEYGGMYIHGGKNDTIINNTINGNMAGNSYGGMYIKGSNVTNEFSNNVIAGNSAVNNHGGLTYFGNVSIVITKMTNNTIYGNSAADYGGLSLYTGNFTTSNNIFWGNIASGVGSQFYADGTAFPSVNNSIIEGGWFLCNNCPGTSADGNIDPLIVDDSDIDGPDNIHRTPDDGMSIQYYSPAINAGTLTDAPSDDITGYTRDATPDIGAYENNNNQWVGSVDTDWDNPSNWSMGVVPDMNQDAYISSSATHYPVIVGNAYCRQLLIPDGSQFTLNTGGHLQTGGDIQLGNGASGQITMNGGTITAYDLILGENSTFIHYSGAINLSN